MGQWTAGYLKRGEVTVVVGDTMLVAALMSEGALMHERKGKRKACHV